MTNKIKYTGKLIGGRYFYHDTLGMYWDLAMLHRIKGEDESVFNSHIDAKNDELKAYPNCQAGWCATIGMVKSQIENLPDEWRDRFQSKTHLFLYDPNFDIPSYYGVSMPVVNEMEADFVWVGDEMIYTWLSGDNMNYRFRLVSVDEVDKWLASQTNTNNDNSNSPQNSDGTVIHMVCPHCGKQIF